MTVTRTISFNDLTPEELAELFAGLCGDEQAVFFSTVWKIAKDWPNSGWCGQSHDIIRHADADARSAISTLAAHLEPAE